MPRTKKSAVADTIVKLDDDTELEETSITNFSVDHKLQVNTQKTAADLHRFLNDPKLINSSSDPTTNIIDRIEAKCYNIPPEKIPRLFKLIEN